MRIGLVGCVKSKRASAAAAKDLYTSALFTGARRAVEGSCDQWFILSAKHGLLNPGELTEPYEETLRGARMQVRRAWSARVLAELRASVGELRGVEVEIHAGRDYHAAGLVDGLRAAGAKVMLPTDGMGFGQKLAFYSDERTPTQVRARALTTRRRPSPPSAWGRPSGTYGRLHDFLTGLHSDHWNASFAEVEQVLGFALPASARRYEAWWANHGETHAHARAWLAAGFRTGGVRVDGQRVVFHRVGQ